MNTELYQLTKKDVEKSAEVISKAFLEYSMFQNILGDQLNEDNIKLVLKFMIKQAILYGKAYAISKDMEAIILYSDFKNYKVGFIGSLRAGLLSLMKIGTEAGKRFTVYDNYSLRTHKESINESHYYVILLGTDPNKQGQGYGTKLMNHLFEEAKEKAKPCYLETHGSKNVEFYKKLGFRIISKGCVPGTDILQYGMLRDADM